MEKKFINSQNIENYEVLTDTGFQPIKAIHETIPYDEYELITDTNKKLLCADNHIVFTLNHKQIFVKDLTIADSIITDEGVERVISIKKTGKTLSMFDLELNDKNHRYYTNNILSHNTYLCQKVADLLGVPMIIVDSTTFTEAGYVGEDVESILSRLFQASGYDVKKTEWGICVLDELDKLSRKSANPSITRDVNGEGVQQSILKLLEGSIVNVPPHGGRKHPDQPMVQIDTKNILFIGLGAFEGIERNIGKRLNTKAVGFKTSFNKSEDNIELDRNNLLQYATHQDLKDYGMIPELLGRMPVLTTLNSLNKEALLKILTEPKNAVIKQYVRMFKLDGIKLTFEPEVYDYIAEKAMELKLGARGLRTITEAILKKTMFSLPSTNKKSFKVTLSYAKQQLEKSKFMNAQKALMKTA